MSGNCPIKIWNFPTLVCVGRGPSVKTSPFCKRAQATVCQPSVGEWGKHLEYVSDDCGYWLVFVLNYLYEGSHDLYGVQVRSIETTTGRWHVIDWIIPWKVTIIQNWSKSICYDMIYLINISICRGNHCIYLYIVHYCLIWADIA